LRWFGRWDGGVWGVGVGGGEHGSHGELGYLCGSFFLSFFVISNLRFSLSDVVEESWGISPFDQS
jgi:hypothetical protein